MAEDKKIKIDSLPSAVTVSTTDVLPLVQGLEGSRTTRAATVEMLGDNIAADRNYADLQTTSKNLIGAINEVKGDAGASALADLTDVNISSPTDGQVIKYDSDSDKWVNADDEGGGTAADITFNNTDTDLVATNVQDAIVEVDNKIPVVPENYAATNVTYNNAASGLSSVNAQGAIDELAATLNTLKGLGLGFTFVNIQSAEITSQGDLPVEA